MNSSSASIHALLIGGRSGVGKTTVSYEVSEILRHHDVEHVLVDGDNLDAAHPKPRGSDLTEANLAALWRNYRALGHQRLIYVNTVSVLEEAMIRRALGERMSLSDILLTADDATVGRRLGQREIGSALDIHLERSVAAAEHLATTAGA